MTDEHKVQEYGDQLPPGIADLADDPVEPPDSNRPDENEGDAYDDPRLTDKANAPSDQDDSD